MTGWRSWFAAAVGLGVLVAVPLYGGAYLTTFVFVMLVAFILAQSWDWVGGEAGYINLAHYAFFGIGAYGFSLLLVVGNPLPLCFAFAVALTAAVAIVASFPLFRLRGDYFAFGTLALMPLAEVLAYNMVPITRGADGVVLPPKYVLYEAYGIALAVAIATLATTLWLNRLPFGYALKSIRNDEQAAEVVGVRIFPAKAKVLCLSAAFAGMAGAVQAWQLSYIDPPSVFGLDVGLVPIAMALLGGSGLLWGPLVGVVILSVVQQVLVVNLSILQATIYGTLILLIGRYMPGGLLRSGWVRGSRFFGFLGREHHERMTVPAGATAPGLPIEPRPIDRSRTILACRDITKAFGGNVAVDKVNLDIKEGEIVGLVGTNGSGKTTLFNCISKVHEATGGEGVFAGRSLAGLRRDEVSRLGIGRTYQIPRPFSDLTVQENIAVPLMFRDGASLELAQAMARAQAFAGYAGISSQLTTRADALNLQQKKALEFARALACRPRLLLVDEVASGLTPAEVRQFVGHIREIRDRYGITVIWVEHIFSALAQVVDRVVVMEQGRIIADGPLAAVVRDDNVLKTYLGSAARGLAPARPSGPPREDG
jgi:branched-chain amino acid transport system permease protein